MQCVASSSLAFIRSHLVALLFLGTAEQTENYSDASNRRNVKRYLVSAAVPLFVANKEHVRKTRKAVIAHLQESVYTGRFLSIALSKKQEQGASFDI
jgi:hypothetical protein